MVWQSKSMKSPWIWRGWLVLAKLLVSPDIPKSHLQNENMSLLELVRNKPAISWFNVTVLSSLQVAKVRPDGWNATELTSELWPNNIWVQPGILEIGILLYLAIDVGLCVIPHYIGTIGNPGRNHCAHVKFWIHANFIFETLNSSFSDCILKASWIHYLELLLSFHLNSFEQYFCSSILQRFNQML